MLMKPFRFFSQKVLPIVYDDSISYYEVLGKLTQKINEIIENDNLLYEYIGTFMPIYSGEWDINQNYDPLAVVSYQGSLYIARTAVPAGISIESTDYWDAIDLPYYDAIYNLSGLDVLHPDQFEGSDAYKLMQALDACTDGGTICLNRKYVLDADVIITKLSSRQKNFIHIIGLGKNAEIDFNGYQIKGDQAASERYGSNSLGGIFWQDINFTGKENQSCFIVDRLIRMYFTGCHFYGMGTAFYGNQTFMFNSLERQAYAQSYYFAQCYFGCCKNHAFDVEKTFDCRFNNCMFEYDDSSINVRNGVEGLCITNCLLEGMLSHTAIKIRCTTGSNGCYSLSVSDCYFEDNFMSIDISDVTYFSCSTIDKNVCVFNHNGQTFIHMPRDLHDTYVNGSLHPALIIRGNSIVPTAYYTGSNALLFDLFHQDGTPWQYQLTYLLFEYNNFEITNGNASLIQLYSLNYRPYNAAYTKNDQLRVILRFTGDGGSTLSGAVNKPLNATGSMYRIDSLKNVETGQDICINANGESEDPNTWFEVYTNGIDINIQVLKEEGQPIIDTELLRTRAGDKTASLILSWKYSLADAP